jgi:hypothetical protein
MLDVRRSLHRPAMRRIAKQVGLHGVNFLAEPPHEPFL